MFGITEQKNKDYKETFEKLEEKLDLFLEQNKLSQEEIKEYKSIVSLKDIELLNLEEQNKVLQENISKLKDIESKMGSLDMIINKLDSLDAIQNKVSSLEKKLNSSVEVSKGKHNDLERFIKTAKKEHFWLGSTAEFKKTKMRAKYFLYALFAAGVLSTIISSIAFKMYSTFTLVENIWLIFSVVLFSYLQHNQKKILDIDLANHDNTIYIKVSDGSWRSTGEEKKRFKWSRRLSHVAVLLNIVALWVISPGPLAAVATIFELLFLGLSIAANYFYSDFSDMYGAFIFFTNKLETDGKLKTLVFDGLHKKLMSFEEFNEQFGKFNK
ncbi:MAG: hypothetical protein K2K50_07905 [Anaeroplasmataceae bacterium]|nr:hypothetical protein [Anaeroplasmataceae bacterium]